MREAIATARKLCSPGSNRQGIAYLRDRMNDLPRAVAVLDALDSEPDGPFTREACEVAETARVRHLKAHRRAVDAAAKPLHQRPEYKPWKPPRGSEAGKPFTPKPGQPGSVLYDGAHRYTVWCDAPGAMVWAHRDDEPRPVMVRVSDCVAPDAEQPSLFEAVE